MMRIAFSDMKDYTEWGNRESIEVDTESGEENKTYVNFVNFKDSSNVDGELISEIKHGKDGPVVKLTDSLKALQWLADYFEMNPMDNHKKDFDNKKLKHDKYVSSEKLKIDREKLKIEKEKVSNDTSLKPIVFIEGNEDYLEWKKSQGNSDE